MSNHSHPPFPDLYDYITPPSPSVSYTLLMMPTPISSRLAPPPTPILAPQTVPDHPSPPPFPPPLVISFRKPDGNFYWQCRDKKQNTPAFNQLQLKQFRIISEIWWGFRPVGIPSSGDSVQWDSGYIPSYLLSSHVRLACAPCDNL